MKREEEKGTEPKVAWAYREARARKPADHLTVPDILDEPRSRIQRRKYRPGLQSCNRFPRDAILGMAATMVLILEGSTEHV